MWASITLHVGILKIAIEYVIGGALIYFKNRDCWHK